jgi:hypothetical protein
LWSLTMSAAYALSKSAPDFASSSFILPCAMSYRVVKSFEIIGAATVALTREVYCI